MKKRLFCAMGIFAMIVAMVSFPYSSLAEGQTMEKQAGKEISEELPTVGTLQRLISILKEQSKPQRMFCYDIAEDASGIPTIEKSAEIYYSLSKASEFSGTNLQVEGVFEGDMIQTDGTYLYQARDGKITIVKAYPVWEMQVVSEISFESQHDADSFFTLRELYVHGDFLVVTGDGYEGDNSFAKAKVFDIADPTSPKEIREIALEGNLLSSRKIGQNVYLVASENIYYTSGIEQMEGIIPIYKDSACAAGYTKVDLKSMRYFPGSEDVSHLFIAGFCLNEPEVPAEISSYLGGGSQVYCSTENLYVARTVFKEAPQIQETFQIQTEIVRFALRDGKVMLGARGIVNGRLLNQFSMDEYEGHLRIAVTDEGIWDETTNNLYVLAAEDLIQTGKIEGMARGEIIYSVRFMGEKGYIVTFKTVDPLFALDLSDPQAPRVTGELKIPGFSQYLHPYDETCLIGMGKDTKVIGETWPGLNTERVVETGMKMALFDVADPENPKELFSVKIGEQGSDSQVLYTHKAFLFSKEKNLIAFPATVYETSLLNQQNVFQGALVYGVDAQEGFQMRGRVTHLDEPKRESDYTQDLEINRVLYIGDTLYTVSKGAIKAWDLTTLEELNSISFETR